MGSVNKTGTYSSKFDFRNAKVTTPKEVRELGSYLLYIHFQALQMASPLSQPCICGVSTTNEGCVREYIEDEENNPCIYHGLPLHTEHHVFIDCDSNEVLGIAPYWKPNVMKKRFGKESDSEKIDVSNPTTKVGACGDSRKPELTTLSPTRATLPVNRQ